MDSEQATLFWILIGWLIAVIAVLVFFAGAQKARRGRKDDDRMF